MTDAKTPGSTRSQQQILDTALRIIDTEGTAGVTMRRLAAELGVKAPSLYGHVRSRESILMLALQRVIDEIGVPEVTHDWRADLEAHFSRMHRVLSSHGDLSGYSLGKFPMTTVMASTLDRLVETMTRGGFSRQDAFLGVDRISLYTAADVYEGWSLQQERVDGKDLVGEVRQRLNRNAAGEHPLLVDGIEDLFKPDSCQRYLFGLRALIDGIALGSGVAISPVRETSCVPPGRD